MGEKKKTEDVPMPETAAPTDPRAAVYVVQAAQGKRPASGLGSGASNMEAWVDVATVTVPARSHRRKVIGLALAESGLRPDVGGDPLRLRVLDAASAHETLVSAVQQDPRLEF